MPVRPATVEAVLWSAVTQEPQAAPRHLVSVRMGLEQAVALAAHSKAPEWRLSNLARVKTPAAAVMTQTATETSIERVVEMPPAADSPALVWQASAQAEQQCR